jgi:hypothetical protein
MRGTARVVELVLLGGNTAARIACEAALVPAPGRYVLAHEPASGALLASALFLCGSTSGGFIAAPPIPSTWRPGSELNLRGPLGRGFVLPAGARRVALVCMGSHPARLLPVAEAALRQNAAVTLVCDNPPDHLPLQLEIQPQRTLGEVTAWCDYAAYDVLQEAFVDLLRQLNELGGTAEVAVSQVLVLASMPCGGLAECGVCSIRTPDGYKLACLDGPVFDLGPLLRRG